jgi:hypothetical protein
MNIYIACGLTSVPRKAFASYTTFIHKLASALKQYGAHTVHYALVDSDPQLAEKPESQRARLCYLWDRELVEQAEVVIADATYASIGLGIELQIAEARDTPVILCFRKSEENRVPPVEYENPDHSRHSLQIGEGYVSLMAVGLPTVFRTIGYRDDEDGIQQVIDAVSLLKRTE